MADHQATAASRAAVAGNNMRGSRFNDFKRPTAGPTIEDSTPSQSTSQNLTGGSSWIWGSAGIGSSAIGGGFGGSSSDRRGPASDEAYSGSSGFEGKQGSSSLLPGSGEHDTWSSKPSVMGWAGDATSPGMTSVGLSQDLSRSPVRIRNATKFESPKQPTEIPRSSSPFYQVSRQGAVGHNPSLSQSPNNKSFLDPSSASIGETLEFQNNRGRPGEIGQFGGQRFGAAVSGAGPLMLGGSVADESNEHLRRGRGLSGSRGIISGADLLGTSVSSAGRSESLPPQQRANSTPPGNGVDQSPSNGLGFPSYTHIPTSHPAVPVGSQQPIFSNAVQGRYGDLSRETREAEMLAAQLNKMSTDDNDENQYPSRQRPPYPSFGSSSSNAINYPQQPSFAEFPYQRHAPQGSHGSSPWAPEDLGFRNQEPYGIDHYGAAADGAYPELYGSDRIRQYGGSGTMSPGDQNGDYNRRSLGSPYYPGGTPPSGMDSFRSPSRGGSQGRNQPQMGLHPEKLRQQLLATQQQQQGHPHPSQILMREQLYRHQQQRQYGNPSPYGYEGFNGIPQIPVSSYPGSMSPLMPPTQPGHRQRHEDFASLRSALLEEFRSNSKSNKRYELKDIYKHVVEFSGDQHGSRFIQQKLETANSDEKETVFGEIVPNCLQLMTDVFGNYVIQKFFEHGNQLQKTILAGKMEGHVLTLSLQMYGCRVVQKALEHILTEQQASLVKELDGHVLKCVKDQNGNHVVQKAIERVPAEHIQFIVKAFHGQVQALATHPYGCRVIQRMLEHCDEAAQASVLKELHSCASYLVQDQYGNYVTQHVIEHGKPEDRAKIIDLVTSQLVQFSKHKFASNVVEKSIAFGSPEQKSEIVRVLVTTPRPDGMPPLQLLMRDQYGNYVIQKLLTLLTGQDRESLVEQIKIHLQALKKFAYGKQINAIEKLIYSNSATPSQAASPPPGSALATPPQLTMDAPSPDSSAPPSTNPSTTGEIPIIINDSQKAAEKSVRIET